MFTSGVAVGQRANTSKFAKYLRPATTTAMDLITLKANVDKIREGIPMYNDIGVPEIYFDYEKDRAARPL